MPALPSRNVRSVLATRSSTSRLLEYSPSWRTRSPSRDTLTAFLSAFNDFLWPTPFQERDRPADLIASEFNLRPTMRMNSLAATDSVAALILHLRERVLRRRADEAKKFHTSTILQRPDVPLSREEVGWVWEFWMGRFNEQVEIRRQAARGIAEG